MTEFESRFTVPIPGARNDALSIPWPGDEPAASLLRGHAGDTFADGLYRIHDRRSSEYMEAVINATFPAFADGWIPFGFDWLGRQFAFRRGAARDAEPVLMFEPGTGEALEVPTSVWDFHERQLGLDPEPALALAFFRDWVDARGRPLAHNEVVGSHAD